MQDPAIISMSSKGQVIIPKEIREHLGLHAGTKFVVITIGDTIILKPFDLPSMDEFDELIEEARRQAREAGLKPEDIKKTIKKVRRNNRSAKRKDDERSQ